MKAQETTKVQEPVKAQPVEKQPLVEPLESTVAAPVVPAAPKRPATSPSDDITLPNGDIDDTRCWNCKGYLNSDLVCDNCGFDRKLASNIRLEAKINKGDA